MKHIIVGVDMTGASLNALARAAHIAGRKGAALHVIQCVDARRFADEGHRIRHQLRDIVQKLVDGLAGAKPFFSLRVTSVEPEIAILAEAKKITADLLVLGAHGTPRLRDAVFGTTATHIVRHSDRPVLVVQTGAAAPYAKAMVALAQSPPPRSVFGCLLDVAPGAEVWAVHAFAPSLRQVLAGREALDREEHRRAERMEEEIEACAVERAKSDIHAVVEAGEVLTVLMTEAQAISPDLVVMGTRRHATFSGSFAVDALFWCPHDILIVPDNESASERAIGSEAVVSV